MEEKITKENFDKQLKELKDNFVNDRVASESFTAEQIGIIKCWMDEAYALGVRNGETQGVISKISDKDFERYTDVINGLLGNANADQFKRVLLRERQISMLKDIQVGALLAMIDKETFSVSMGLTCL